MPRKAGRDATGALHHVIIRGIERRKIFRSDFDRKTILNRLSELIPEIKNGLFWLGFDAQSCASFSKNRIGSDFSTDEPIAYWIRRLV